jgi:hypothetical protein
MLRRSFRAIGSWGGIDSTRATTIPPARSCQPCQVRTSHSLSGSLGVLGGKATPVSSSAAGAGWLLSSSTMGVICSPGSSATSSSGFFGLAEVAGAKVDSQLPKPAWPAMSSVAGGKSIDGTGKESHLYYLKVGMECRWVGLRASSNSRVLA